jgi:hypothetical protein
MSSQVPSRITQYFFPIPICNEHQLTTINKNKTKPQPMCSIIVVVKLSCLLPWSARFDPVAVFIRTEQYLMTTNRNKKQTSSHGLIFAAVIDFFYLIRCQIQTLGLAMIFYFNLY